MGLSQRDIKKLIHYDPITGITTRLFKTRYNDINSEIISKDTQGRVILYLNRKQYKLHRLIWLYIFGYFPKLIDHINGDMSDNRLDNLREASPEINQQNRRKANKNNISSKLLGVSKKRNKWSAQIRSGTRILRLGCYTTKEEAHQVYINTKRKIHEGCTL